MNYQQTNLNKLLVKSLNSLSITFSGPWSRRSIGLISLLMGYSLGINFSAYYLDKIGQRPFAVMIMVFLIEITVRLRAINKSKILPIIFYSIDNIRLGLVYSIVLEAFKLGS